MEFVFPVNEAFTAEAYLELKEPLPGAAFSMPFSTLTVYNARMENDSGNRFEWTIILAATLLLVVLLSMNLGVNDLVGGDEGYYGVMARNILEDPGYIINTSLSPLGPPGDKPFLYPLILAGSLSAGGIGEIPMRLVTLIMAALSGIFLMLIGTELGNRRAGLFAGLMYLFTPLLANTGRIVSAEPLLVSLSLAGIWLVLVALRGEKPWTGFIAGAFFGLAFLTKLWLVAIPAAGAVGGIVYFRYLKMNRSVAKVAGSILAGFMILGSLQLLLCLIFSPDTFRHWLGIYTGFSLSDRVVGGSFADYWHRPWYFYLLIIGRSFGQWLILVPLGIMTMIRRRGESAAPAVLISWIVPLVAMSLIPVKSGNYILPLMPALYLVAGFGAAALTDAGRGEVLTLRDTILLAAAGMVLCLAVQLDLSGQGLKLHSANMLRIQIVMMAAVISSALPHITRRTAVVYVVVAVAIAMAGGLIRDIQIVRSRDHVTGFRNVAATLEPGLEDIDPRQPCFISPEWPSMSFYTFRTGRYWVSPYVDADPEEAIASLESAQFFYIIQEGVDLYGGYPDRRVLKALKERAYPIEFEDCGEPGRVTVYINRSLRENLSP